MAGYLSKTASGSTEPFDLQVSRGQIPGHTGLEIFGFTPNISNTASGPMWEGQTQSGGLYTYPGSAAPLVLVSSSASDTTALSVRIEGCGAGFVALSETIALNGTTVANAQSLYPALYSATSGISGWWSGSTFTPPNMTNKMLEGVGTTAVGQSGGSNTASLGVSNLPAHTHTTTLTNGTLVVREDGGGDAKLTANSSYGPYNTYTISATTSGGGNGTSTGDAVTVTNAHIAVYFQIKAH